MDPGPSQRGRRESLDLGQDLVLLFLGGLDDRVPDQFVIHGEARGAVPAVDCAGAGEILGKLP